MSINGAAHADDPVIEAFFDETEFRVGINAAKSSGTRRNKLQFRVRPIMMIHAGLSYLMSGVAKTMDIVAPPACLFGTTAVDLCSALLVRLCLIFEVFGTTRRFAIVLHHDAAPSCIRAGLVTTPPAP